LERKVSPKQRKQRTLTSSAEGAKVSSTNVKAAVTPTGPPAGSPVSNLTSAWHFTVAGLLAVAALVLYWLTASRWLPTGDSAELITAAWTLGVAHQPGYPLFTLLSHLAGYLPFGTPAFRLNLLSSILDALTVGILAFAALRIFTAYQPKITGKWLRLLPAAAVLAGFGVLAVSRVFWLYSSVSEVFALNNLLATLTLALMLEWLRTPERRGLLYISGLLAGLAFTNQLTFVLLAPGLLTLLIAGLLRWRKRARENSPTKKSQSGLGWRWRDISILVALFIVGLLPYFYLPLAAHRDPAINFGDPSNFTNFWKVVSRSNVGTFSLTSDGTHGTLGQQFTSLFGYFWHGFGWVASLLAIPGLIWFALHRRLEGAAIALAFIFSGPFFAVFANPKLDIALTRGVFERFYILPGLFLAFFTAAGVYFLIDLGTKHFTRRVATLVPAAGLVGALVLVLVMLSVHLPDIRLSGNRVMEDYGPDLLESLEPQAILIMNSDYNFGAVAYCQLVKGLRPDVVALQAVLLRGDWYVAQQKRLHPEISIPFERLDLAPGHTLVDLIKANLGQRPVYAVGPFSEDFTHDLDVQYWGLATRLALKGSAPDPLAVLQSQKTRFSALHFPQRIYPSEYWENLIAQPYGRLAFNLGFIAQKDSQPQDIVYIEKMYRLAILNAPDYALTYKNLALLLINNQRGNNSEKVSLLQKYLTLAPNDPENGQIRQAIQQLQKNP
jgi:hypothetical protein